VGVAEAAGEPGVILVVRQEGGSCRDAARNRATQGAFALRRRRGVAARQAPRPAGFSGLEAPAQGGAGDGRDDL